MNAALIHDSRPQRIYWETTRACDLACRHCRAEAAPYADPLELTTDEGVQLLRRIAAFGEPLPHVVLTGGDPLKRLDVFELIGAGRALGLGISVAPSATPLLTPTALRHLHRAGIDAISLSLDGATAEQHDALRGIPGTHERTLEAARVAHEIGLPFQINTLVCTDTVEALPLIYAQVLAMGAARWSLFFLVTVGRGQVLTPISSERAERLLHWLAGLNGPPGQGRMVVTTTEAPQLRRVVAEQRRAHAADAGARPVGNGSTNHAAGIRDGNGIMFISHTGEICPSGFLELSAGNIRTDDVVNVYRTAPLFRSLRDIEGFEGRCGRCEYCSVCGGSRARAFAASGNPLAEDPLCAYQPTR
jgi:radical SAM protein